MKDIVLMNFRGTNLSRFKEHSFAKVYLRLEEAKSIYLDSTFRSCNTVNILTVDQVRLKLGADEALNMVRFDPGETAGDCFTVGPLEIFWRELTDYYNGFEERRILGSRCSRKIYFEKRDAR